MAPSRTPGRSKREADYSNIGVAGRKTGITLKDTGIRDEHGLEPIDGIFSSPEKSPLKKNGQQQDATVSEEEEMEIGQSTIPEPTELLSAHRSRSGKPLLPPPRARLPMKTSLGSSPRRSMGMSSPARASGETPSRAMSHPLVSQKLDFSDGSQRKSLEPSPRKAGSSASQLSIALKAPKRRNVPEGEKKRPFILSMEDEEEEEEGGDPVVIDSADMSLENRYIHDDEPGPAIDQDDLLRINGSGGFIGEEEMEQNMTPAQEQSLVQLKSKRGRPKKDPVPASQPPNTLDETTLAVVSLKGKRKRAPLAETTVPDDPTFEKLAVTINSSPKATLADADDIPSAPVAKKRAGRPPKVFSEAIGDPEVREAQVKSRTTITRKKDKLEVLNEEEQKVGTSPLKPGKLPNALSVEVEATPIKGKNMSRKPPPSERDPNARVTAAKGKGKLLSVEPSSSNGTLIKPRSRSLFVTRSETPAEDGRAFKLRSGRTSVKPIAFWRGEKLIYGEGSLDGNNLTLPGIKEVIRTEEVIDQRPKPPYRRRPAAPKRYALEDAEEDDDNSEPWETDPGVLRAEVMQWDPYLQRGVEDNIEDVELALAPAALQNLTREVKGAKFTYAKTLTLPFFHSGMVDLPAGGVKRMKNSRKNHMVFWVFYGRVKVDVAGTVFSIGRGGMWQVPRGNFYSIANDYRKPARVFFAQGCYMTPEAGEPGEDEMAPPDAGPSSVRM